MLRCHSSRVAGIAGANASSDTEDSRWTRVPLPTYQNLGSYLGITVMLREKCSPFGGIIPDSLGGGHGSYSLDPRVSGTV